MAISPIPVRIMFGGMTCMARAMAPRPRATPARPLPISSQLMVANIFIATARMFRAMASGISAAAVTRSLGPFMSWIGPAIAVRPPATPTKPLPISSHDMVDMIFIAAARMSIAVASRIIEPAMSGRVAKLVPPVTLAKIAMAPTS